MSTEFETDVEVEVWDDALLPFKVESVDNVTIKWDFEVEMRSWGVKGIYVHVPDQKVILNYTHYDDNGDDEISESQEVLLQNVEVDTSVPDRDLSDSILPRVLEFRNGKVLVQF